MMRPMSLGGRSLWGDGHAPPPPPPIMAVHSPAVPQTKKKKPRLTEIAEEKDKKGAVDFLRDLVEELEGDSDSDSDE